MALIFPRESFEDSRNKGDVAVRGANCKNKSAFSCQSTGIKDVPFPSAGITRRPLAGALDTLAAALRGLVTSRNGEGSGGESAGTEILLRCIAAIETLTMALHLFYFFFNVERESRCGELARKQNSDRELSIYTIMG